MTLDEVITQARALAIEYYRLTGKPLGITGEIAECHAAKLLGLQLAVVRTPGYDAIDRQGRRIQIKARRVAANRKRKTQRVGSLKLDHAWDVAMLVLLDDRFDAFAIYEAERGAVAAALKKPGSKARNVRGALSVSAFKSIGKQIWPTKNVARRKAAPKQKGGKHGALEGQLP